MSGALAGAFPLELGVHRSPIDDAVVVQLDTGAHTGPLRVFLNEAVIWNRDPEEQPAMASEIAEDVLSSRYGDVDTFRFAMAQDGPALTADGILAMLREAVARGMDYRDDL